MASLARGLPGADEVPVLKELNDIRELLELQARAEGTTSQWDMTVHDRSTFFDIANAVLPEGKYTAQDINDAYNQLTLIAEFGGSADPHMKVVPVRATQGRNKGKYLIQDVEPSVLDRAVDDNRSRQAVAAAMVGNWALLPDRSTPEQKKDLQGALKQFIASSRGSGEKGESLYELANTGFRKNKAAGSAEFREAYLQNMADKGRGYDRLSRDRTVNQKKEFGHYVPVELGGADVSGNGRMQAMSANKATREKQGVTGALRALGPGYKKNLKIIEAALGNIDDVLAA